MILEKIKNIIHLFIKIYHLFIQRLRHKEPTMRTVVLFICCILIFTVYCKRSDEYVEPQKEEQKITQQNFEKHLKEALDVPDSSKVTNFVKIYRYKVGAVIEQLNNTFLKNLLKGNNDEAVKDVGRSQWLADLYQQYFQDDYFQRRLMLFQSWNNTQRLKKIKADSLKDQAEINLNSDKFDISKDFNQQSLQIYKNLGDKENEAVTLNSLGLCYSNLINFTEAEKCLNQALEINKELGLTQNTMINLNNIGDVYKRQRKYSEALKFFQQSLEIAEEIDDEVLIAQRLNNLGDTNRKMNNMKEASDYLAKALTLAQRNNDLSLQSIILLNYGAVYAEQSDFKNAIESWQKGLVIARKLEDSKMQGSFLSNMGNAYRNISNYDDALKTLKEALKLNRETHNRWTEGNTLREIGVNLYLKGEPDSALAFWHQSLDIYQELADTSSMGMLIGYIGIYYKNTGQPYKALEYYQNALELSRKTGNDREASNILCNMGNVYNDLLAEYSKAEELFKEALEIKQRIGEVHIVPAILGNLGNCCKNRGDYQNALKYYFDALDVSKKVSNRAGEANNLSDIGAIYTDVGDYRKATSYYQNALSIFRNIGEIKSQVKVLINIGANFFNKGKVDSAFTYYKEALKLAQKINHKEFESAVYFYLGDVYKEKNANQQALECYNKAIKLSQEINDIKLQGESFTAKGDVYYKLKQYSKALNNYDQGLRICQKIGSPEGIWKSYYGIGRVSEKIGKEKQAEQSYNQAIETIESIRAKLTAKTLKESFLEDKIDVYQSMINLLLKMGREDKAYEYLERSKAKSFLDIISTSQINVAQGITPERLERKKRLERRLNKIQQELMSEYSVDDKKQNPDKISALEDSLKIVRNKFNELLQEIELNHPRYADLAGVSEPLALSQVQERVIQEGTVVIEYMVGKDHTIVWVIGYNFNEYERIDLKRDDLETMVKKLLQPFKDVKEGKLKNFSDISFDVKFSGRLYDQIFRPIEQYLKEGNQLIIVPDGILHYLPFEALVTKIEKKKQNRNIIFSRYKNAHYLIEKYAISYAPSASVLDPKLLRAKFNKKREDKLIAFGNPDFGKATQLAFQKEKEDSTNFFAMLIRSSRGWIFNELPKAAEEVKAIGEIMKPSLLYLNKEAKEEYFKQQSGKYPFVHLATHCIVEETQPMYSRIVFAQDDDPAEDGFLHTYEVFNLRLNTDLITLSACETGLGKLSRGEGLIGLTRAFMYAGAPSVLVSLWSVSESTADVMKYFYRNLNAGKTKTEALRQAKLKLIKSESKFKDGQRFSFANPFLWAPFVLVGEWQ